MLIFKGDYLQYNHYSKEEGVPQDISFSLLKVDPNFAQQESAPENIITIVLNTEIKAVICEQVLKSSSIIVAADGGANRLLEYSKQFGLEKIIQLNYIIGDLDSISDDVIKYYTTENNTQVILSEDQDFTDFQKALRFVGTLLTKNQESLVQCKIIVLNSLGGRFDQTLSVMGTLKEKQDEFQDIKSFRGLIHLISEESHVMVLNPGNYVYKQSEFESTQGVGIFPFYGMCKEKVLTENLKWNLTLESPLLELGKFISSSNEFLRDTIQIYSKDHLLLITTLKN